MKGIVFNIQKMSIHDGPGIRTTVFFKGCPLRCLWCSNPESQRVEKEIAHFQTRCVKCGYCAQVCPKGIIEKEPPFDIVDRSQCDLCEVCVLECCTGAKKTVGEEYTAEDLLHEILKDKSFYDSSGGGVTFSGGEPTAQAEALIPLVKALKAEGIHVCIDTNGGIWNSHVEELFSISDLVLLDVKQINPSKHLELTGRSNGQTLKTAEWLETHGKPFWLRYVLVPGISDAEEDIRKLGERFGRHTPSASGNPASAREGYRMLQRVEILPYHTLGVNKYETLGIEYKLKAVPLNTKEQLERAKRLFDEYFDCAILN